MPRTPRNTPKRVDAEAFWYGVGFGIVSIGIGMVIGWATRTAPTGSSSSIAVTLAQRIVRLLPQSTQNGLAYILAWLFIIFGCLAVCLGVWGWLKPLWTHRDANRRRDA
jgi:uncharacterized membrane protein HdeD (DUF308 family)